LVQKVLQLTFLFNQIYKIRFPKASHSNTKLTYLFIGTLIMSQPTPYSIQTNFNQDEVNGSGGRSTVKTASLDTEFDNLKTTLDEILANLALLQRDDGKIKDGLGEPHLFNLSSSATGFLKYSSSTWSFIPDPTNPAQTAQAAAEVAQASAESARDLAQQHKNNSETAKLAAQTAQTAAELAAQSTSSSDAIQAGSFWYSISSGTGTAYVLNLNPSPSSISAGFFIHMKAHTANTGPATLNVNSLGAKPIKRNDGSDLKTNDIEINATIILLYDGTNFQLFNSEANSQAAIELNSSNIFRAFEEIQENHGGALLMEAGWSDSFSNPNEQGADEANSTGYQHDLPNTLYKGTDPGVGLNLDQNFTTDNDYTGYSETLSDVSISGDTITINNSHIFGPNVLYAAITIGVNSAVITTRTDDKNVDVTSGHSLSGSNVSATITYHKFESGKVKLNDSGIIRDLVISATGGTINNDGAFGSNGANQEIGQVFTAGRSGDITNVKFRLKSNGGTDNIFVNLFAVSGTESNELPAGPALATSDNYAANSLSTSFGQTTFTFSTPYTVSGGTKYAMVLDRTGANSSSSAPYKADGSNSSLYSGGHSVRHDNAWSVSSTMVELDMEIPGQAMMNNVVNEYIPIIPNYSKLLDVAPVSDINSLTITETLNSANIYYAYFKNVQSAWGANTKLVIWDGSGNERSIARNNAGTWEYNSETTFASTTWTNATKNDIHQSIRDSMGIAANQMTGTTMAGVTDTALTVATGKTGIVSILHSTTSGSNPEVDQTRINYDSVRGVMDLKSKTYDPGFAPGEAYVWSRVEHSDADGSGAFSISRNGGNEWTTVSMVQQGEPLSGDIRILRGTIDVSSQTTGQDLRSRYQTTQGKDQFLHSWGMQTKS
jgi:hypothetical protein